MSRGADADDLDIDNNLTISSGTFTAPAGNLNVAGNFTVNGGTFNHNDGTVIFDDASKTTTIIGTTFYDFSCTTPGKQLNIQAGATETILNTLTLTGNVGNEIVLRSTTGGEQWNIDPQGTWTVDAVDVQDSVNLAGAPIYPTNSIDSGNTINWFSATGGGDDIDPGTDPVTPPDPPNPPPDPVDPDDPTPVDPGPGIDDPEEVINITGFWWDEGKRKYAKFKKGKYRTVVIVFSGRVVVTPYDEMGLRRDDEVSLTAGQRAYQTGTILD